MNGMEQTAIPDSSSDQQLLVWLECVEREVRETLNPDTPWVSPRFRQCSAFKSLITLSSEGKIEASKLLISRINNQSHSDEIALNINNTLLAKLLDSEVDFPKGFLFSGLFTQLYDCAEKVPDFDVRPFSIFVRNVEQHIKKHGTYETLVDEIRAILEIRIAQKTNSCRNDELEQEFITLDFLISGDDKDGVLTASKYRRNITEMTIATNINRYGSSLALWQSLLTHLDKASASRPSAKFLNKSSEIIDEIGIDSFRETAFSIFEAIIRIEAEEPIEYDQRNLFKGLLWSMSRFNDDEALQQVTNLTLRCFRHVPDFGPAAESVGNAGIYTLGMSEGLEGLGCLCLLKAKIRRHATRKQIQKYLDHKADEYGLTSGQIEELAVPDFDLDSGVRVEEFGDYKLRISLLDGGNVEQRWINPKGKLQKAPPAFTKNDPAARVKLKETREQIKLIKQVSGSQSGRIESLYLEDRLWQIDDFNKSYRDHGLVGQTANRLIWLIDDKPCLFYQGQWVNHHAQSVRVNQNTQVALWHPLQSQEEVVLAWRDQLDRLNIQQPFKQAHREIYIVTPAELQTETYSNRFAAHIVKQYQMNALAVARGWMYALIGNFDSGGCTFATKRLPAHGIEATLTLNERRDEIDGLSDAGMWNYVGTDRISFYDAHGPVGVEVLPPIVFSELMRDVDLFVAVCSVGNDQLWEEREYTNEYRAYWGEYAFGGLSKMAQTRKLVLEKVLPRLKISDVTSIDGNYLVVKGKIHSYKIHIGSGNVLIMPANKYLCIVPRPAKGRVFLPFEGDIGLSIILSKAFMLAEDDKIEDPGIIGQLQS